MPVRSCRVTIQDMDGVAYTVEVTAATLYEAVAQGLAAIRCNEWVAGIAQRKARILPPRVEMMPGRATSTPISAALNSTRMTIKVVAAGID
jgi:hypothetical protein